MDADEDGIDDTKLNLEATIDMPKNNQIREGWGLATYKCNIGLARKNCKQLIATDGSNQIHFIDVASWSHIKSIDVMKNGKNHFSSINELETIPSKVQGDGLDQYVFANRLGIPTISMIDLRTGQVVKEWDFSNLLK